MNVMSRWGHFLSPGEAQMRNHRIMYCSRKLCHLFCLLAFGGQLALCFQSSQIMCGQFKRSHQTGSRSNIRQGEYARTSYLAVSAANHASGEKVEECDASPAAIISQDFVSNVLESLENKTFLSLTLRGPSVAKKGKHKGDKERLRGCIKKVQGRLIELTNKKSATPTVYLQATIKYHSATDIAKNWKLDGTEIKEGLSSLFMLPSPSSLSQSGGDDLVSEWGERGLQPCGSKLGIQGGELCTAEGTWELGLGNRDGSSKQNKRPNIIWKQQAARIPTKLSSSHDRTKQRPVSSDAPFFQALGLSKVDGKPRPGMSSKLKQCHKFVEIVGGLIDASVVSNDHTSISTVDMGCGRGYLTFALHSYLVNKYEQPEYLVQSRGIDVRPKLVKEVNGIARSLGPDFDGLVFDEGTIESVLSKTNNEHQDDTSLDILIALHACDTATDDALWSGIQSKSHVLVVAPCCHKQVRGQLDSHTSKLGDDHPLADVLRHNIYRERIAETVTDSVRALLLEIAHYNVQVFEFIGGEHTSKNVMIAAAKRKQPRSESQLEELRKRLRSLCMLHGIKRQRLAEWMGEAVTVEGGKSETTNNPQLSSKSMPPL